MASNNTGSKNCFQRFCPKCNDVVSIAKHVCKCGHSFVNARLRDNTKRKRTVENNNGKTSKPLQNSSFPGINKRFQRLCPNCNDIINIRRYICNCSYSFVDARRKAEQEQEAHHEEMGKQAANYKTLSRSLAAIKKHTSKLRGGGYQIAVVYYKVRSQRTIRGILPGSGLSKVNEQNLIKYFYLSHMQDKQVNASSARQNQVNNDDMAKGSQENHIVNLPKQQQEATIIKKEES